MASLGCWAVGVTDSPTCSVRGGKALWDAGQRQKPARQTILGGRQAGSPGSQVLSGRKPCAHKPVGWCPRRSPAPPSRPPLHFLGPLEPDGQGRGPCGPGRRPWRGARCPPAGQLPSGAVLRPPHLLSQQLQACAYSSPPRTKRRRHHPPRSHSNPPSPVLPLGHGRQGLLQPPAPLLSWPCPCHPTSTALSQALLTCPRAPCLSGHQTPDAQPGRAPGPRPPAGHLEAFQASPSTCPCALCEVWGSGSQLGQEPGQASAGLTRPSFWRAVGRRARAERRVGRAVRPGLGRGSRRRWW